MANLFIDTCQNLTLGLLDQEYSWIDYYFTQEPKTSGIIHFRIDELLEQNNFSVDDVKRVFILNGPGSYTGVRVGEGIGQIFNWQKKSTYSFYHHQIPELMGNKSGHFVCSAFKGEFFVYNWEDDSKYTKLCSTEDFTKKINEIEHTFTNDTRLIKDLFDQNATDTQKLLKNHPNEIFRKVEKLSLRMEPFYFRELKDEFSKSPGKK